MKDAKYNWQMNGWPKVRCDVSSLEGELEAFAAAYGKVAEIALAPADPQTMAEAMTREAVKTSAIEGVVVDESVVMSSICRVLGVAYAPPGFTKDIRAEGVARMMTSVRQDWRKPLSADLLIKWHGELMNGDTSSVLVGAFRRDAVQVVRRTALGETEVRFVAPPAANVPDEIAAFVRSWRKNAADVRELAVKAALMHPHFESIHPFGDGNGRIGRAILAKTLNEKWKAPLVLPVSATIERHRRDYYEQLNEASRSLDWTAWAAFMIPVLTESMESFVDAVKFVAAKRKYLTAFESVLSPRAKKVILRMLEDGRKGVDAGLSAAKWVRMTKVSKPTATRDLAELEKTGAVVAEGAGRSRRYRLTFDEPITAPNRLTTNEGIKDKTPHGFTVLDPINKGEVDPINEGLNRSIALIVEHNPGIRVPQICLYTGKSRATVERSICRLIEAKVIEHRGSKKTGGYFVK